VFAQCQHCEVWHTLASNNPKIYEEIRFDREDGTQATPPAAASTDDSSEASDHTAADPDADTAGSPRNGT